MGRKRKGGECGESARYVLLQSVCADVIEGTKPKKRKKSKHRHHPSDNLDVDSLGLGTTDEPISSTRPIKLKIKLGDQLISSSDATL